MTKFLGDDATFHPSIIASVKDYGAVGNGSTDDTPALQAALNAGAPLAIPAGTYITNPLTVPSGTVLLGVGSGNVTFKRKTSSLAGTLLGLTNGASNLVFSGFTVDGNKANNSNGYSIAGTNNANLTMRDVIVQNDLNVGALFITMNPVGGSSYCFIEDCGFNNCSAGGLAFLGANNVTIMSSVFASNGSNGVEFTNVTSDGLTLVHNEFSGNASHGLSIACTVTGNPIVLTFTVTDVIVSENYAVGNVGYGLLIQAARAVVSNNNCILNGNTGSPPLLSGMLVNSNRVSVIGNTCFTNYGDGIDMGAASIFSCCGNVCDFNGYYGIELASSADGICSSNTCANNFNSNPSFTYQSGIFHGKGTDAHGIGYAQLPDRVTIIGNTVLSGANQNYGIVVDSNATNCLVANNNLVGSGSTLDFQSFSSGVKLDDPIGNTFANLPNSVANGSRMFVSDADPGSSPLTHTGAQTGSTAFRQNGAWKGF